MRCLRIALPAGLMMLVLTISADAQRKPSKRSTPKKTPVTKAVVPPLDVRVAREKVGNQLANVNRFVNVLGPIAQGIENFDNAAVGSNVPESATERNETNKRKVILAIRNLKDGLALLESEFRTKAALQKFLPTIQGITDLGAQAEDAAIAGRFVASKDPLRTVGQKLTDTLALLPYSQ